MKKLSLFILSILTLSNISFAADPACSSHSCTGHHHSHSHSQEDTVALVAKAKALGLDKLIIKDKTNTISICEKTAVSINGKVVEQENLDALFALFTENESIYFTANSNIHSKHIYTVFDKIRNSKAKLTSVN